MYHAQYFEHITLKQLVIGNVVQTPVRTFSRMLKYITYGFTPTTETKVVILRGVQDSGYIVTGDLDLTEYPSTKRV